MSEQQVRLVPGVVPNNHGNTVASWVLVALMTVGMIVGAVGFSLANLPLLVIGVALLVIGAVAGFALKKAGHGQGGAKTIERAKAKGHH
ncbi:HGxxPAAW family protein [Rothia sp. ZJ1223]|uniref:HGxxPAAW family protein n=1 Tax=Rothia sp. ZJ1223 TaxID=2811098 RepID=UPI00195B67D7|nr:HGxxPAAW family protein [Rothia sp. ZJ1223]MBM7050662.1 hypothetical protein [Rothia sp. ZJ1223]